MVETGSPRAIAGLYVNLNSCTVCLEFQLLRLRKGNPKFETALDYMDPHQEDKSEGEVKLMRLLNVMFPL